jgi:oxygen-independent coproporphyrinogen III oxidase
LSDKPSLYIHFPFCRKRCAYCDFYSSVPREDFAELSKRYVDRLLLQHEILSREFPSGGYRTVYLGGGTPSLLPPREMKRLFRGLPVTGREEEITLEVNPESLTDELLDACSALGINRISMGVQSLNEEILIKMGRLAGREENLLAIERLGRWADNRDRSWSIDLIFGFPGQSGRTQLADLDDFLSLDPPHFSLYQLTVEEGTDLYGNCRDGRWELPPEEEMEEAWEKSLVRIEAAGYERYEISSYCRNGYRSRHNMTYWSRGAWLGLGAGASSMMNGNHRFTGKAWKDFLEGEPSSLASTGDFYEHEYQGLRDIVVETIMMGLRTRRGLGRSELDGLFPKGKPEVLFALTLERWKGKLILDREGLRLNSAGLDWHSAVMVDLLLDLDKYFDYNTPL